jgi:selenocysteine lyase/cysteine desulfurase
LAKERIYISLRGASLRITPHVYNSQEDVERLVRILQECFEMSRR